MASPCHVIRLHLAITRLPKSARGGERELGGSETSLSTGQFES